MLDISQAPHAMETTRDQANDSKSRGPTLATERLSRVVGKKVLVNDINVQVQLGEVLAIVGPSGSGKTSFLRLLNRLDEPTSGTVRFNGQDYRALPPQTLRQRIGMVMQTAYLFPGTVAKNVAYGPLQRGQTLTAEQIATLLQRVGLPGYEERDVNVLSGGEAQRVSIARTLANDPEILLLDEPTSALDEDSARKVEDLVLDILRERQMTCVMITHKAAQARRVARRSMIIKAGTIAAIGLTDEVLQDV
jgi:putative ABC transport system ATP-binding protein